VKSTPRKMVVVAATGNNSKVPPGMSSGHDYGVLGYPIFTTFLVKTATLWT